MKKNAKFKINLAATNAKKSVYYTGDSPAHPYFCITKLRVGGWFGFMAHQPL